MQKQIKPEHIEQQALGYLGAGRADLAEPLLAQLVIVQGSEQRHLLNWAFCLIECEQYQRALSALEKLPVDTFNSTLPRLARGIAALKLDHYQQALNDLGWAYALDSTLLVARIFQIQAILLMGDRFAAEAMLDSFPLDEPLPTTDAIQLVKCLSSVHRYESADHVIKYALAHDPDHPELLLLLAHLEERRNNLSAAESLLDRLPIAPHAARLLRARLEGRKGAIDQAVVRLKELRLDAGHSKEAFDIAEIDFEIGRWLNHTGEYAMAWSAYESANRSDRERDQSRNPQRWLRHGRNPALIDPDFLDSFLKARQRRGVPDQQPRSPIFLVGFPRSGTTLLDNMLNSHPGITVLEEKLLLEPALASVEARPGGYPAALQSMTESEINLLRESYWQEVEKYTPVKSDVRLVDKYPLNLLRVPLILTIFPDAQWLFAIRHPLDVVLSCFTQRLEFSDLTMGFSDLAEIAEFYESAIRLWRNQQSRLGLDCIDVKYEDVVADASFQLKKILGHFGLPWIESVLEFDQHAKKRWIGTPSYDQVARPLYSDSVNRWRHYEPWLSPAAHVLSGITRELGYS